ncbi:MAG: ATP-binding protein [Ardenticatenia bacterium]|nr:ATP-binding protein [Ardenticatenia bacterium]
MAELCRSALTCAGDPQIAELRVRQAGERERTYQALATAVGRDNGTPWGVVTVMRDITTQKELERLKSNFLSVISHELRTPLHSIGGFVDVILMGKTGPINELQRDFLETVKEQAHHLYQLIEDLLEFNRLESGQFQLSPAPVEIGTLIKEVVEAMFPVADERKVRLVNRVSVPTATVEGDRKRLRQVFINLVDNALKFTPAGGSITLQASAGAQEVVVSVQDTGIGIPEEEQARIFERFYQVDSGLTREHRGTGLGLAIVKHIVEQHGGRIWVESRVNEGSTFFVGLPYALPKEQLTVDLARLPSPRDLPPGN